MAFDWVSPHSMAFLAELQENPDDIKQLTLQFIAQMESKNLVVPDFEETFKWLNTSEKLSFKTNLSKKLCIMDFFTYCCINCMHVLPDLYALEKQFSIQDGVVVLGVHSAKFNNEKLHTNILSAVLRYDICHAVVNDPNAIIWNQMSIQCWPTFVIISPEGKVLLYLVGEGHRDVLLKFVDIALEYYKGKDCISNHDIPIKLARHSLISEVLQFPGKLAVSPTGNEITIADTGHHRIIVVTKNGIITHTIGTGQPGLRNGSFDIVQFNSPQGLVWNKQCIYVADTENHALRKINLETYEVSMISGTGVQGNDKDGGKDACKQEISSPWDVLIGPAPGTDVTCTDENCLYIAMAGTHQIWCYFLEDGPWLKKSSQKQHVCLRFAGSGNEENRNNSYPHKAAFAQPSGFTLATVKEQKVLYIADSESSSVRKVDVKTGVVTACVGGELDPTNLFAYGDVDGKGVVAKLQHPLAVAYNPKDGLVYVADSYNHKLKVIDPVSLICTTLAGTGHAGYKDGSFASAEFNEPGDICFNSSSSTLYVADTNNHKIRIVDLEKKTVSTLLILAGDEIDSMMINDEKPAQGGSTYKVLVNSNRSQVNECESVKRNLLNDVEISIELELGSLHYTDDVDSKWQVTFMDPNTSNWISYVNGDIKKLHSVVTCVAPNRKGDILCKVELLLYVCNPDNTCLMKSFIIIQPVAHGNDESSEKILLKQEIGA